MQQVAFFLENYYWKEITLDSLAGMFFYSSGHLNSMFRKMTGKPIYRHLSEIRIMHAQKLLQEGQLMIKEIAERTGFADQLYFSRQFHKTVGMSPTDYANMSNHS